jgi:hypothetical protein
MVRGGDGGPARLEATPGGAVVDLGGLFGHLRGLAGAGAEERAFRVCAAAALEAPRPLAGGFELKVHGPRLLPRLVDEAFAAVLAALPSPPVVGRSPELGVALLYVVADEEGFPYLTEAHLASAGVDREGVHGVSLAVLRQRLEEDEIARALAGETVRLESADGLAPSRLLILPERLGPGEELVARVPAPTTLILSLDSGPERAEATAGPTPLILPRPIVLRRAGPSIAPGRA